MAKGKKGGVEPTMSFEQLAEMLDNDKDIENFQEQSDDVVGYWAPDKAPIKCIPVSAKIFDGQIEPKKPSILIIARLVKPTVVALRKEEDQEEAELKIANEGELVGIWGKPGMKGIRDCAGKTVWMKLVGEKNTGKPNPMKVYKVLAESSGSRIPIIDDTRDESAGIKTWLEKAGIDPNAKDDEEEAA